MLGQIKIEYVFAIVAFAVVVFYIASQTNTLITSSTTDARMDLLRAKALNLLMFLAEDYLANRPYELSIPKIQLLNNSRDAEGRCIILEAFSPGAYRVTIYSESEQYLFCGYRGVSQFSVSITRPVILYTGMPGAPGNITVEVW